MPTRASELWSGVVAFADSDRRALSRGMRIHVIVGGAGLLLLACAAVFVQIEDITGSALTREPQRFLNGKLYIGVLSNLGALIWMAAVVMALVGWAMTNDRSEQQMFLAGALISAVLLADDFFLVHEFAGHRTSLPIEKVLVFFYMLSIVVLVAVKWRTLGPTAVAGVVATMGFLGGSVVFDTLFNSLDQLYEDGLKFLGICMWATTWTLRAAPWRCRGAG